MLNMTAFASDTIDRACLNIEQASRGERSAALSREAYALGQLIAADLLPRQLSGDRLVAAAVKRGIPKAKALATVAQTFRVAGKYPAKFGETASPGGLPSLQYDDRARIHAALERQEIINGWAVISSTCRRPHAEIDRATAHPESLARSIEFV